MRDRAADGAPEIEALAPLARPLAPFEARAHGAGEPFGERQRLRPLGVAELGEILAAQRFVG